MLHCSFWVGGEMTAMQTIIPITVNGVTKLRTELETLKTVERPKVIAAIAEARAHGDLKENAEYHAARERQGFIEGRILEIEAKLANCQIIDISQIPNEGKVIFGATVTLLNLETQTEVTYQIMGVDEANLKENKISISSPTARAMIGKYIEDVIEVTTPEGPVEYEIVDVEYL
ncbi:transcription elongation factor GreA [Coxiella burnetii]|uniref:Transcription elongation factor GreA n=2 Tax=Coxiella burnetii TaxID=777 RepID=Q83C51_COXBU|nr:transcription elongation factor GreA [Coxiella burnetii]NP_820273.2 transcription elongation factor [Coxiella burnetii RSA 493]AAO90787.2 transcription elongation factor [Coxiella burnetii RSA 493]ABS78133.2 transcription elongation factor [Coxiella burnetii Dugway 5J108-111]ACJ18125.1 transcription elongation factor [Coxiella burnetii CbuG_Q212]ACJ20337.1 transcription elongation factor [Coxiella burnetii CbuK_Q154]AIT63401.1 Transcription elongation factor GreA [Coxiella burnetii str. Na